MTYLHDRGMKGYLTINVLIFDSELKQFQDIIQKVANAGVDALIMYDNSNICK
jgi:putative protease